jgi:subtilisin family serine protease
MQWKGSRKYSLTLSIFLLMLGASLLVLHGELISGSEAMRLEDLNPTGLGPSTTIPVVDTSPPSIHATVAVPELWSPNAKLVDVRLSITATDDSGESPIVNVRVYSNERDQTPADPAADAFPAHSFRSDRLPLRLRSQRNDAGGGRFYLIVMRATDGAGNMSFACRTVVVPHDRFAHSVEHVRQLAADAIMSCGPLGSPLAPFNVGDPANSSPGVAADAYTTDEDVVLNAGPLGILRNDIDAQGEPLSAMLVSGPSRGLLTFNANGSFSYTPEPNFYGTDRFSYKAKDDARESAVSVVALTVNPVNDAPFAVDNSYSLTQNMPLTVLAPGLLANDSDIENSPLAAAVVNGPTHGTLTLDHGGSLTYIPQTGFIGTDSFTYKSNDGELDSVPAAVRLTVRPSDSSFGNAEVLEAREAEQDGQIHRTQLLRTEFKYPFILVEEHLTRDAGGAETLVLPSVAIVADHIIVRVHDSTTREQLGAVVQELGLSIRDDTIAPHTYLTAIGQPTLDSLSHARAALAQQDMVVAYAEPDYIIRTDGVIPNDARMGELWGLNNVGQEGGRPDGDIDATEAWQLHTGSHAVKVGVIDTGIDYTHFDLASNIWTNPGEIINGIDDDHNGFVDDTRGWDFYSQDNDPMDDVGHGTHVAGTIGATGNNSVGVAGVNWSVSMVPIRFLGRFGGSTSDAVKAIRYATTINVDLTSNSWGTSILVPDLRSLKEAIDDASNHSILFVAAAGNSRRNTDNVQHFPSGFDSPNIISVAATDRFDQLADFSNFGPTTVDLAAPGNDILSTFTSQRYEVLDGTSMATPHVSGVCALVKAAAPHLTHLQIKNHVLSKVDPLASLSGKCVTGGRLNAFRALLALNPRPQIVTFHMDDPFGSNNGYYRIGLVDPSGNVPAWDDVTPIPGHWGDAADDGGITNVDINGNGIPDLVALHVDDPAGPNIGWYKIGWDLEPSGVVTGGWTPVKNIPGHWGDVGDGADIATADLNNNGRPDLVAFHIDDPAGPNIGWYKIGWDLNQNGDVTGGWDPVKQIPGHWGDRDGGGGFAIKDLNGNGRPDFVTFHMDDPAGANIGWYRVGWDVDTAGNVTGGWTEVRNIPGHWGDATEGGGIVIDDVNNNGRPDFVVLHVDDPAGPNFGFYRIGWDVDVSGFVTGGWTEARNIPGHWGDAVDGAGVTIVRFQ